VVTPEEIEHRFAEAGWDIDNGFPGYLVIGYSDDTLSILAHRQEAFEAEDYDDSVFELLDHTSDVTYWVREVPIPHQATRLLQEHGQTPDQWEN
jgi:hypothetical protein